MTKIIGTPPHQYEWLDNWARIPDTPTARNDGRTHGIVVTPDNRIVICHQAQPAILIYHANGELLEAWGDNYIGAHGLTLVQEDQAYLWLADSLLPKVVKLTLSGQEVMHLDPPDLPIYQEKSFQPTWVAVNEERHAGNGDIWVADGYGSHYIHRYDKYGNHIQSINGTEGERAGDRGGARNRGGAFDCPHGIWIDRRKADPELYIADRSHRRVQVYDLAGNFKRVFGTDFFTSPCSFATVGDYLYIPELIPRLTVLDIHDQPVCYLGENEGGFEIEGWPNRAKEHLHAGKFNSPHAIATDNAGNLYVVEWIIGGRITKLVKCDL